MNRKLNKIQIVNPFADTTSNWELLHQIESSLNQYLSHPHIFPNAHPKDDAQSLGRQGIEQLVIIAKQLLQLVQILRNERKAIETIKLNATAAHEKLEQHEQIVRNYEKKFTQRTKALVEENRVLKETNDKIRRASIDTQETFKLNLQEIKTEASSLRAQLIKMQLEKKNLLSAINNLQEEVTSKQETIVRLQKISKGEDSGKSMRQKLDEVLQLRIMRRKKQQSAVVSNKTDAASLPGPPIQQLTVKDMNAFSTLLEFLTPTQILQLACTSKRMRLFISSRHCTRSLCRSIISVKNRQIGYYHKHIQYFQKLLHKIPEQVLQMAYFRYHILKQTAGQDLMQALNGSALIFEGRFEGEELYSGLPQNTRQIPKSLHLGDSTILEVDPRIVQDYKQERSQQKNLLMKQLQEMYGKIKTSFQLYRADEESSTLFTSNILKHFSRVFVLGKALYLQAQYLQKLNWFLLAELNKWDRMEIDKNLQLQDLRAQLEAERKLKLFFTDKSIKSEQKALLEQNLKLNYEMKHARLNDLMNITCSQKQQLGRKNDNLSKANDRLSGECRQLRKLYELTRQKYNHVIQQLVVVKETIIKMNII